MEPQMTPRDKLLALAKRLERMPTKAPTEKDIIVYELRHVAGEVGKTFVDPAAAWLADKPAAGNKRPRPRIVPIEVM